VIYVKLLGICQKLWFDQNKMSSAKVIGQLMFDILNRDMV